MLHFLADAFLDVYMYIHPKYIQSYILVCIYVNMFVQIASKHFTKIEGTGTETGTGITTKV